MAIYVLAGAEYRGRVVSRHTSDRQGVRLSRTGKTGTVGGVTGSRRTRSVWRLTLAVAVAMAVVLMHIGLATLGDRSGGHLMGPAAVPSPVAGATSVGQTPLTVVPGVDQKPPATPFPGESQQHAGPLCKAALPFVGLAGLLAILLGLLSDVGAELSLSRRLRGWFAARRPRARIPSSLDLSGLCVLRI